MDLKVIPRSYSRNKFILCIIDDITNYLITVPIHQAKSEELGEALIENAITKCCVPEYIIMDQDSCIHIFPHDILTEYIQYQIYDSSTI